MMFRRGVKCRTGEHVRARSTKGLSVHCDGKLAVACVPLTFYSRFTFISFRHFHFEQRTLEVVPIEISRTAYITRPDVLFH
jgi:hypothetical protein